MSILNWDFDNYLLRSDTDWAYWTCKSREDLDPKKETSSLRDTSITSMYPKRIGFFVQGHCRFLRGVGGTAAEGAVANLSMKSVDFWRYPFVDSKCINRGLCSNPIPHDSCWNVALPLRPAQDCAWCELCFVLNRHERWLKFHMRISRCENDVDVISSRGEDGSDTRCCGAAKNSAHANPRTNMDNDRQWVNTI